MKVIKLENPIKLPDRPFFCYFATAPEDAAEHYQEKNGRVPKAVYYVDYGKRMDSYVLAEVE